MTKTGPQPSIQGESRFGGFEGWQECDGIEKRPVDAFPGNTSELVMQFDVHPNQIQQWKDQLLGAVTDVFDDKPKVSKARDGD